MKNVRIKTVEEIEKFLEGNQPVDLELSSRENKYSFIRSTLVGVMYKKLRKKDRGVVKAFLGKVTGYEERHLKRLIKKWKKSGLRYTKRKAVGASTCIYKPKDIDLLIKTDILHKTQNGLSTKTTLQRELASFGHTEYQTIANISVSHVYNVRKNNRRYIFSDVMSYSKTKATSNNIGERRKPLPYGKPGYIRVDSVHQGDRGKEKGVYHINLVDEVTQWELVGCVSQITDEYMEPLLEKLLEMFPFVVLNFHSDNGSEYINKKVEKILERLLIKQTKSRSRKCNDNALVESKNGSIIRKHMGRNFIEKSKAMVINKFYMNYFNIYLNYHRVCLYATDYTDKRGKIRKKYDQAFVPYERFKSLENAEQYLKKGISFAILDKIAYAESDNEFAEKMKKAKEKL
ncbi:DDE-type integrase/transposase/recombinase [Patescibacteria group bacterium]|nr:DDE-type integrase/transposase/recombinase [Patescibacteria group bacterium]